MGACISILVIVVTFFLCVFLQAYSADSPYLQPGEAALISIFLCWVPGLLISAYQTGKWARRQRIMAESKPKCPTCDYDLTGLSEARCPECGGQFTLDQLWRAWFMIAGRERAA